MINIEVTVERDGGYDSGLLEFGGVVVSANDFDAGMRDTRWAYGEQQAERKLGRVWVAAQRGT